MKNQQNGGRARRRNRSIASYVFARFSVHSTAYRVSPQQKICSRYLNHVFETHCSLVSKRDVRAQHLYNCPNTSQTQPWKPLTRVATMSQTHTQSFPNTTTASKFLLGELQFFKASVFPMLSYTCLIWSHKCFLYFNTSFNTLADALNHKGDKGEGHLGGKRGVWRGRRLLNIEFHNTVMILPIYLTDPDSREQ